MSEVIQPDIFPDIEEGASQSEKLNQQIIDLYKKWKETGKEEKENIERYLILLLAKEIWKEIKKQKTKDKKSFHFNFVKIMNRYDIDLPWDIWLSGVKKIRPINANK